METAPTTVREGAGHHHPAAPAFHTLTAESTLGALAATANGLGHDEAAARLERYGPNRLTVRRRASAFTRFLRQFHNVLIYVLLAAAAVTAALAHWVDTGVIVAVVVINALVGFVQEGKAEQALAAIRRMLSLRATVLRDGRAVTVAAEELVPGDVVLVQSGDRVPADVRLLRVKSLRIEEAALTGESVPVEKDIGAVVVAAPPGEVAGAPSLARDPHLAPIGEVAGAPELSAGRTSEASRASFSARDPHLVPIGDRRCMAFSGTLVTYGQGRGVVTATGDATELGRIAELLTEVERLETPLLRKMAAFSVWLSVAIVAVATLTFAFGTYVQGNSPVDMFLAAVGLAVAAIPEGLPAIITITLAIGVQRMAGRNAIVRILPSVEALGSVTCICSDKTGTLTRNEMTARSLVSAEHGCSVSGVGYAPHGDFEIAGGRIEPGEFPDLVELLRVGLLCNDSRLTETDGEWRIEGDPTEGALVVVARKAGLDAALEAEQRPRTDVIPFESEHRFMATLHHDHAGHAFVYLKGAPEIVLAMCAFERRAGERRPLRREDWETRVEALAADGQRVLACAFKALEDGRRDLRFADVEGGLTLLGLFGMIDPPREEAIRAVASCHKAGIGVKMITGDHKATAVAVAAQLGVVDSRRALSGVELEAMSDERLREMVPNVNVYARVSPEHKLRLVQALQARGEVVAMTGDGVNDAPALKRADVGVAMGVGGTEAAKEAAEIVLADDNFASITNAVEEGRTVYDNLRKTILFILPTNGGEAGTVLLAVALGMALPILPVQILWVNMITAVTLALALAFEPAEANVMRRPPRDPRAPIFSGYFLWRTLLVSLVLVAGATGIFVWEQGRGESIEIARTAAVNTLVMFEVFYLLNSRFLIEAAWLPRVLTGNRYVPLAIAAVLGFQLLYTYAPFMHTLFRSAPLSPEAWGRILLIAFSIYLIVEIEKWLVRLSGARVS